MLVFEQILRCRFAETALRSYSVHRRLADVFHALGEVALRFFKLDRSSAFAKAANSSDLFLDMPDAAAPAKPWAS